MITIKPVDFNNIQQWFLDYQKKSKNYEMPPEGAECIGIYNDSNLIGYFITVCYDTTLEINQGYLSAENRHKNISKVSMRLLEEAAKKVGVKYVKLGTNRAVGSYIKFMRDMGYTPIRFVFSKEL